MSNCLKAFGELIDVLVFIIDVIFLEMLAIINIVKRKYGSCQQRISYYLPEFWCNRTDWIDLVNLGISFIFAGTQSTLFQAGQFTSNLHHNSFPGDVPIPKGGIGRLGT